VPKTSDKLTEGRWVTLGPWAMRAQQAITSNCFLPKVGTFRTVEPPGGLLLPVFDCYNISYICTVERENAWGIVWLGS
jgi:hypothetical protein